MAEPSKRLGSYPRRLDYLRYACAFLLYMYGGSKLAHMQFSLPPAIANQPISSLTGYQLTWYYYGHSRTYAAILGLTQVLGATLLLFRKTAFLGAAIITPMMVNILLVNIFILVNDYGPLATSSFILASMLVILWHGRDALVGVFWSAQPAESVESVGNHVWIRVLIVIAVLFSLSVGVYQRARMR